MTRRTLLIILFVVGATLRLFAASAEPPIGLTLSINDAASRTAFRGWPLVFIGQAFLTSEQAAEVRLEWQSLQLVVTAERGQPETWPVRLVSDGSAMPVLNQQKESTQVRWLLTAEQTQSLRAGAYSATLNWAGAKSLPIAFTIAEPPAALSAGDTVRKARLESEAALLMNDPAGALAALSVAGVPAMDSIPLLQQRARVLEKQGNHAEVIKAMQRAQEIYRQKYPYADHPPLSLLTIESRAMAALVSTYPSGTRPVARDKAAAAAGPNPAAAGAKPAAPPVVPAAPVPPGRSSASGSSAQLPTPSVKAPAGSPGASNPVPLVGAPAKGVVVPANELDDARIRGDSAGQWAATAKAGSSYSNPNYGPAKATGAPDVASAGDSVDAWCPGRLNLGLEWIEVAFASPAKATEVRVRQNHNPGAIVKVEAVAVDGTSHVWWEGKDLVASKPMAGVVWFAVRVPPTEYPVAKIKLTLDLSAVPGWKQIDAVQIVSAVRP